MRENRTYGSEGGEAGEPAFPTPITGEGACSDEVHTEPATYLERGKHASSASIPIPSGPPHPPGATSV